VQAEEILESTIKEVIEGCKKQNLHAQKELYNLYCDEMYTLAYRITRSFELSNDVLQDAFIEVFRDIKKFRGEGPVGKWIKTIVFRVAIRLLKKESNYSDLEDGQWDELSVPENMYDKQVLEHLILSLPDGYRAVFCMVSIEGYSHRETAEILGISEGTSKSQLHHAKKMLRDKIKHYFGDHV